MYFKGSSELSLLNNTSCVGSLKVLYMNRQVSMIPHTRNNTAITYGEIVSTLIYLHGLNAMCVHQLNNLGSSSKCV